MYETAKKSRAANKAKAERIANRPLERVDSSDWTPPGLLNADVKTGMRPVSKQALKRGGKVHGTAAKARADRKARKAGGRVGTEGEQPLVDRYINRDLKKANEYRDGKKHEGALKHGGRAKKADGGGSMGSFKNLETGKQITPDEAWGKSPTDIKKPAPTPPRRTYQNIDELVDAYGKSPTDIKKPAPGSKYKSIDDLMKSQGMKKGGSAKLSKSAHARKARKEGGKVHSDVAEDKKLIKSMIKPSSLKDKACYGGRMKKADGGGADPRLGLVKPKAMEFAQNVVTPGLKKGGRIKKDVGGEVVKSLAPVSVAAAPVNVPPVSSGLVKQDNVLGNPPPSYDPAKYDVTSPEYKAAHPNEKFGKLGKLGDLFSFAGRAKGGRIERAAGGRTKSKGKGKTHINIVIAQAPKQGPEDMQAQMPPMGGPAGGPAGIPVPVPPPQVGGGMPMGMPMPMAPPAAPMGAPQAPAMGAQRPSPFQKGGRVTKVARSYKDMEAGAGSGEGRLQKTDIAKRMPKKDGGKVGHRSYRSYKDMDAGAGSGLGRLEKTEIETKKSRKG